MKNKILVTYASRSGSTAGVAESIAGTLKKSGAAVDLLPMGKVENLDHYSAVVAGSAINGSKWLPEGMKFLRTHQTALKNKKVATFMVCITLGMKDAEKYRDGLKDWMSPVREIVHPVSEGYFAGALDFKKIPFSLNSIGLRLAVLFGVFPKGDQRDWQAITSWAESLPAQLF